MTRVLSALLLIPLVLGVVWFLPPVWTLALAAIAALLGAWEYAGISWALGARFPRAIGAASAVAACIAVGSGSPPLDVVALGTLLFIGVAAVMTGRVGPAALPEAAAGAFALVYIGLPLGAIAAIRAEAGREAVLLLVATVVISDSAQYYTGRAFGRVPLAPSISPKKTREGAVGGVAFGTLAMVVGGRYVFPAAPAAALAAAAVAVVLSGIIGDLFESLLKRSAGVKDSSSLIPGHGGILDRIDSWLFAGPVYFFFVRLLQS